MPDDATGFRSTRAGQWLGRALSKAAAVLILVGVGAGTGALVSPSVPEQLVPYGDDSLGREATQPIRITRDYDVADPDATERRRAAAVEDVRPVYDFDEELQGEVESRVAESFVFARNQLAERATPMARAAHSRALPAEQESLREEFMGRLQTFTEPKDFEALSDEGFSVATEQALTGLVHAELSQSIVEDRTLLPAARGRGLTVRGTPSGDERVALDLETLSDLSAARSEVEHAAEALHGELTPALHRALGHLARGALRPNLTYDAAETARRRARAGEDVVPVVLHFARGERIIEAGERIDAHHLLIFRAIRAQSQPEDLARSRLGGALFAMLLAFLCYKLARPTQGRRPTRRDALFVAVVLLLNLALTQGLLVGAALLHEPTVTLPSAVVGVLGRLGAFDPWGALPYAMPVTAGTLLVRLLLGPELVGLYAICSAVLFGLLRGASLPFALFALAGSLVAGRRARHIAHRRQLFGVGAYVASTNVAMLVCSELLAGRLVRHQLAAELLAAVVGGALVTPLLVSAVTPIFEALFGYVSDSRLTALCNLNHPALKELIVRAPGTYHHSILLADLAASAASAVGANPWLARAVALYHDLGKARSPLSFNENQKGSAAETVNVALLETLRNHVAEGVELGRRYKLPRPLLEAIAQHHGTRRVAAAAETTHGSLADDSSAGGAEAWPRYAGPRPRTRETAIVMLADAVQTRGRPLKLQDTAALRALVRETVTELATEGQLDDSGLTLGQLPQIIDNLAENLSRTLAERIPEVPLTFARPPEKPSALELN